MLTHRGAVERSEAEASDRVRLCVILNEENEAGAVHLTAAILTDLPVLADPELLPLLDGRIPGVQTLPVSAALARLAHAGLVEVLPQRGTRVKPIAVGPSLLVYLDQAKRLEFLKQWQQAIGTR